MLCPKKREEKKRKKKENFSQDLERNFYKEKEHTKGFRRGMVFKLRHVLVRELRVDYNRERNK